MNDTILELRHVSFGFNKRNLLLNDIGFSLKRGRIYTLMGGNGSGKSTLFNIISGFLKSGNSGEAVLYPLKPGTSEKLVLTGLSPYRISKAGVGRTFQDLRTITRLSVMENILLAMRPHAGAYLQKQAGEIMLRCSLTDLRNRLVGEISYGQQKLVTLACCIATGAELILLDEPVAGIGPALKEKIASLLKGLKAENKTILQIEHNTDFIQEVTDHLFFLNDGGLRSYSSFQELRSDPKVMEAYI